MSTTVVCSTPSDTAARRVVERHATNNGYDPRLILAMLGLERGEPDDTPDLPPPNITKARTARAAEQEADRQREADARAAADKEALAVLLGLLEHPMAWQAIAQEAEDTRRQIPAGPAESTLRRLVIVATDLARLLTDAPRSLAG